MPVQLSPESFEAEAMPHLNDLFRTAARLMMNRTDVEDLIQEVYLQAWKSFSRYKLGTNCRAWLYKIMFNKLNHHRRKKYTQAKWMTEVDDLVFETTPFEPAVPPHLTDEEIIAAIDKLPEHYREVVLLADVEEFAYREIAEILQIPMGTVMSRLNRGRSILRGALACIAQEYGIYAQKAA